MEKKLRRKILENWIKKVGDKGMRLLWEKCLRCDKVHGYGDVTEMDLDELINIAIKEHENRRAK